MPWRRRRFEAARAERGSRPRSRDRGAETLRLVRPDVAAKLDHVVSVTEAQDAYIAPVTIDELDVPDQGRWRTVIRAREPSE
jgi:hypothetical protein